MSSSAGFSAVFNLSNLTAPASGVTHAGQWQLALTAGVPATLNMLSQMEFLGDFLGQAMTVDNTANPTAITITETTYGWTRQIQAGELRTFQYPGVQNQNFVFSSSGNINALLSIYDWPAFPDSDYLLGNASGTPVTILGTAQVQDSIAENYLADLQSGVTYTDRSLTLTGSGASITLMAANPARKSYYLVPAFSPTGNYTTTWVNFTGAAAQANAVGGSVDIASYGQNIATPMGRVSTSAITVFDDPTTFGSGGPWNLSAAEA